MILRVAASLRQEGAPPRPPHPTFYGAEDGGNSRACDAVCGELGLLVEDSGRDVQGVAHLRRGERPQGELCVRQMRQGEVRRLELMAWGRRSGDGRGVD
mmetsp:Transcript_41837/g.73628  ORF Transcript_41837/g.73628 Transcript_41837/m.73628 type:complete len:99 (-) Transcript_41837:42-338(-)